MAAPNLTVNKKITTETAERTELFESLYELRVLCGERLTTERAEASA